MYCIYRRGRLPFFEYATIHVHIKLRDYIGAWFFFDPGPAMFKVWTQDWRRDEAGCSPKAMSGCVNQYAPED